MSHVDIIPNWAIEYINIPFSEHGRNHDGCDCWGLVRLVLKERFNIQVDSFEQEYESSHDKFTIADICQREAQAWHPVDLPQPGDVVLMRLNGVTQHTGIVIAKDFMLHVQRNKNTVIERMSSPIWKNRITEFYRYVPK